jgi:hypothetical protein
MRVGRWWRRHRMRAAPGPTPLVSVPPVLRRPPLSQCAARGDEAGHDCYDDWLSATDASYRYGDRPVFSEIRVGRDRNHAILSGIIFMRVLGTHEFLLFVQSAPISDGRRPRPRENAVILDRELKL